VRYNRLSREHELRERTNSRAAWQALNEELCCTLLMEMQHAGIGLTKPYLVRTVVRGNKGVAHYHPVCDYLDTLPEWDGHDHIDALFRRITHDEQQLLWLRRWLLGMVAQVQGRLGKYGNSVCPLIISRQQGWGKSQFAKLIVPPTLQMFYTDTFNLAQEETCIRRMASYWLINVDELDRFSTTRMATLKNLVQLASLSLKRAHRGQMEELERMASFIATSNRRYLLRDETGSRRFICIELKEAIDVTTPVDHAQLYAQALAALDAGERSWFDDTETRLIEAHNQGFSTQRGVWDLLRLHFEPCEIPKDNEERLKLLWPANHVYDYLREKSPTAMEGIERTTFGWYLKEIGARQVRVDNHRLWAVRKVG
jgi:predicted P-loop ATPase